jgi:hypothetical protein
MLVANTNCDFWEVSGESWIMGDGCSMEPAACPGRLNVTSTLRGGGTRDYRAVEGNREVIWSLPQ